MESSYRRDRAEDFFGERSSLRRDVGEHGGLVEQVVVVTAGAESGSRAHARRDDLVDLVPLAGVDQRAERDLVLGRVTDHEVLRLRCEPLDERVVHPVVHDVPAGRHADLTLMEERPEGGEGRGLVDVGILEHDQRGVPAQFQVRALEVPARQLTDPPPGRGRAGEGDDPHQRMGHHRLPYVGGTGQHLEHPCGQPGLLENARHGHAAGDRRAGIGLEYHGVAEGEGRRDGPDAQNDRHVERRDDTDDTGRNPASHRQARLLARQQLAVGMRRQRGGLVALLLGHVRSKTGHRGDGPDLTRVPVHDLGRVLGPKPARVPEHRSACGIGQRGPFALHLVRRLGRLRKVRRVGHPDLAERGAGRRLDHAADATAAGDP